MEKQQNKHHDKTKERQSQENSIQQDWDYRQGYYLRQEKPLIYKSKNQDIVTCHINQGLPTSMRPLWNKNNPDKSKLTTLSPIWKIQTMVSCIYIDIKMMKWIKISQGSFGVINLEFVGKLKIEVIEPSEKW